MTLKIGVHPNNLHLQIAALHWAGDTPVDVQFVPYAEGRETGRRLRDREIDLGGTGSTPPLIAQLAGVPLAYVAASAPRGSNGALVVRADDGPTHIKALAGRRVALLDGSFHTAYLAAALEREGLTLADVTRVELAPAAAHAALAAGEVDAWIAMAPWLERVRDDARWRLLGDIGAYVPNRSVFWAHRDVLAQRGDEVVAFLSALAALGDDIGANPAPYARHLAEAGIGGFDAATWHAALADRDWTLLPATRDILDEQQREADLLHRHRDFAARLDIDAAAPRSALDFRGA